ncbi:MAG: D-tyrosyl-tRNA(Tyr) deacylase [Halanaerobiales bacterium]|nr:D-tyrosyl-tRNA(Tyr) deacylase [Halanaerobiales bacterium]
MRAVVQRVKNAKVEVDDEEIGAIDSGLLVFLGIGNEDSMDDIDYLIDKIVNLRIFEDKEDKMNLSAMDLGKDIMVVSQFTLYGDCRKGKRPNFLNAAPPDKAERLYDVFINKIKKYDLNIETGEFKAMMDVDLVNDGPVTLLIDSKKEF